MAQKLAKMTPRPRLATPFATTGPALTALGGLGASRDAKSELFLLAVSNLVGERAFHESARARDERYAALVAHVTQDDPEWVAALVPWLRSEANLRTVSIVTAAEYVAAGGPAGRGVVSAALQRADEPGEMLAYWTGRFGRSIPKPVKRGVADACQRLYSERSLLKYDGQGGIWRFGDVLDLCHPHNRDAAQGDLYEHALDRRHGHADEIPESLPMLRLDKMLREMPEARRRSFLSESPADSERSLAAAGWAWERLAGWLPGGMDAQAWEAVIPQMGYMALLRNLRNFDQAKVSDRVAQMICAKLADPAEVASSRQLPIRFYSAFKEAPSLRWAYALEQALDLSLGNIPALRGQTLILLDLSPSMSWDTISAGSQRSRAEIAAVFAVALARRCEVGNVIAYSTKNEWMEGWPKMPLLRAVEAAEQWCARWGNGTATFTALAQHWNPRYDRVVIITDEQTSDAGRFDLSPIPALYTFNLGGYKPAQMEEGPGRFTVGGGLSDACFQLLATLDSRRGAAWPHMVLARLAGQERFVAPAAGHAVTRKVGPTG